MNKKICSMFTFAVAVGYNLVGLCYLYINLRRSRDGMFVRGAVHV